MRFPLRFGSASRRWMVMATFLLVGVVLLVGWLQWRSAADAALAREQLAEARRATLARRYDFAQTRLAELLDSGRGDSNTRAEALYWQGVCWLETGKPGEAVEVWSVVGPGTSEWHHRAIVRRADVLIHRLGRFEEADGALALLLGPDHARGGPLAEALEVRTKLWRYQGRLDELAEVVRRVWWACPDPADALRGLWRLETDPFPLDGVRTALEQARALNESDPGVRLGLANLATYEGRFEEALALLELLREQRPEQPAIARAELRLARAWDRPDLAGPALQRLKPTDLSWLETLELNAWLRERTGGTTAERIAAWSALLELAPKHPQALERLAELARTEGRGEEADRLRRLKREADDAKERYRALLAEPIPPPRRDWPALAEVAGQLARPFETAAWQALVKHGPHAGESLRAATGSLIDPATPRGNTPTPRTLAALIPVSAARPEPPGVDDPADPFGPRPVFEDVASAAGLAFVFDPGHSGARQLPETMSGGVGLIDFDNDGWLDVYAVQGGPFPPPQSAAASTAAAGDRLFRNRGDGSFEDVTDKAGLAAIPSYGHGVAVGDYDNDGFPDLFLTRWDRYLLMRNRGDGTFEDVTEAAGLAGLQVWPTSAAWGDFDRDGDLDLYVCHYLEWDAANPRLCRRGPDDPTLMYCDPRNFPAVADRVFRNDGGVFVDVSVACGVAPADQDGRGLGVLAADLDGDGWLDLYVANDTTANFLFRNKGAEGQPFVFEELGALAGVAGNADGGYQAGMGVAGGDLDGDGLIDLFVTNFFDEGTTAYLNLGHGQFADRSASVGILAVSRPILGFGLIAADLNNDGHLDLVSANGHVNDYAPYVPYRMPGQVLLGDGRGKLKDVTRTAGEVWTRPRLGRGLVAGDFDHDGGLDFLLVDLGRPLVLARNLIRQARPDDPRRNWVNLVLKGDGVKSPRDPIGAVATLTTNQGVQVVPLLGGGSYLSAPSLHLHVGLGSADKVNTLEIRWPSGRMERFETTNWPINQTWRVEEGRGRVPDGIPPNLGWSVSTRRKMKSGRNASTKKVRRMEVVNRRTPIESRITLASGTFSSTGSCPLEEHLPSSKSCRIDVDFILVWPDLPCPTPKL